MIKKLWKTIRKWILRWIIWISSISILNAGYIICYLLLLSWYVIFSVRFSGKILACFSEEERFMDSLQYKTSLFWTLITILFLVLMMILLQIINKYGLFDSISQSFAYLVSDILKIPGWWIPPQINF